MTELAYQTGLTRTNIETALRGAGKDPSALKPADLAALEDFHTLGRLATSQLVESVGVTRQDRVLDAGTGIGGTARFLAAEYSCSVTAVDLTEEYCDTARWLNESTGLADRIDVIQGNVLDLPFSEGSFDVIFSQHVQMNVADKLALYTEARRVLTPGGRLGMWDITGKATDLIYPLPWADDATHSHVVTSAGLRAEVEAAGLHVEHWTDLTEPTRDIMRGMLAQPPAPLGLHVFVRDFPLKVANLVRGFEEGWLQAVQVVASRHA
jgi:ubiquinone/menaquinone biosynthesis C-methylase UbiE